MSLDNEYSEKPQWYVQLEQERQKLSASVAEALADKHIQDDDWEEEEEQMDAHVETANTTTVIPPRLSLQSKVLPTVQVQGGEASAQKKVVPATSSSAGIATLDDEPKDSVFVRLARRLTASFSTFGVSMQPDMADVPTKPMAPAHSHLPQSEHVPMIPTVARVTNPPQLRSGQQSHVVDAPSSAPLPSLPASHETSLPESKRRLARTTRVRLETAPVLAPTTTPSTQATQAANIAPLPTLKPHQSEGTMNDTRQEISASVALPHDTYDKSRETSAKLPVFSVSPDTEKSLPVLFPQRQFFGCGMFASGQGDKMIDDSNVTETCIVLVMLTGSPGPVVVHYVSLYPGIGFTVHLTAPADKETNFNYVILAKEER